MSVRGEFVRSIDLLLEFLEKTNTDCESVRVAISAAQLTAKENLTLSAQAIVALEDSEFRELSPGDGSLEERDERYGHVDDMDREIDEEPNEDGMMISGRKPHPDKNFLSIEEAERRE